MEAKQNEARFHFKKYRHEIASSYFFWYIIWIVLSIFVLDCGVHLSLAPLRPLPQDSISVTSTALHIFWNMREIQTNHVKKIAALHAFGFDSFVEF